MVADVCVEDLDGDGLPDLVGVQTNNGSVLVLQNLGDGGFSSGARITTGGTPTGCGTATEPAGKALFVADYSGHLFVITVPSGSTWWGDGQTSGAVVATLPGSYEAQALGVADFDGDGRADVMVVGDGNGAMYFNTASDGGWVNRPGPAGVYGEDVVLGDLDGDGKMDAVVSSYSSGPMAILLGAGDGGFTSAGTIEFSTSKHQLALHPLRPDAGAGALRLGRLDELGGRSPELPGALSATSAAP